MGLTQSIHDINIINANNGTDEQIPISNIQSMSNSLNNMQQKYNLIPSQNLKKIIKIYIFTFLLFHLLDIYILKFYFYYFEKLILQDNHYKLQ